MADIELQELEKELENLELEKKLEDLELERDIEEMESEEESDDTEFLVEEISGNDIISISEIPEWQLRLEFGNEFVDHILSLSINF